MSVTFPNGCHLAMGRWGPFLFQSDWQFDRISDFGYMYAIDLHCKGDWPSKGRYFDRDKACNNDPPKDNSAKSSSDMSRSDQDKPNKKSTENDTSNEKDSAESTSEDDSDEEDCMTREQARAILDGGLLELIFSDCKSRRDSYTLFLISAKAMEIGASFTQEQLMALRRRLGLAKRMRLFLDEEIEQLRHAIKDYPNDGTSYKFHSPSLLETANAL